VLILERLLTGLKHVCAAFPDKLRRDKQDENSASIKVRIAVGL